MSIQTNSPDSNLAASLSADEIAALLGFADAAAMVEAIGQYCVAGGTVDAITLTVPDWSEVDGAKLSFRASGGNSGAVTIAVNGGTARDLRKSSQASGIGVLNGGELLGLHTVQWDSPNSIFRLLNYRATKEDIPSTLNATTLPRIDLSGGGLLLNTANSSYNYLCGGSTAAQSSGSFIGLYGNSHATKPGDAEYYTGSASGAAHSFFDKNGAGQLAINEYGLLLDSIGGYNGQRIAIGPVSAGTYGTNAGAQTLLHVSSHATYPGAHQQFAPLSTRAASTAFAVCPVASGDAARVEFLTDGSDVYAEFTVVAAGGVYLERGNALYWINTSSPGAVEIGVYISAGVLYCKPGSGFTGKISTFSKIGKA